jgi:hypothetical protein
MKFTPKSDQQIEEENQFKLLTPGIYDFEIVEASEQISKNGNDMIKLKLCIYGNDGEANYIFDYLMEKLSYKLKHCSDACGLLDKYESGELTDFDLINKTGKAKVGIQKSKDPQYGDKNVIQDYVKRDAVNGKQPPAGLIGEGKPLNDEIPF